MKHRVITAAMLWLAAGIVLADPPAPPPGAEHQIDRLVTLLDLDAGQKVAVQNVLTEQHQQMMAQWQQAKASGTRPNRQQMRAQHEQMQQATVEKLRPILSDVQLKKFEVLTERPHGPPHGKRPPAPAAAPAPAQ
ncbi:MAG TPA: hypothetical protein VGN07_03135 [Steroidobacteraceae bacterium]|jgi:Spy/CpxP family protein refolding chaperone